jgi:hypothetical protein
MKLRTKAHAFLKSLLLVAVAGGLHAATLTKTDINNPVAGQVTFTGDTIEVIAGGNDTWDSSDSFTYVHEQRTGDFDVQVRVRSLTIQDTGAQDSAKASLMVRSTLEAGSPNIQINALVTDPKDAIETIYRPVTGGGTDDMPDRPTGNTTPKGTTPYPDVWLRIRRLGNLFTTLYGNTSNSWTVLSEVTVDPAEFPSLVYVGLSTVNHVSESEDPSLRTTAVYEGYGDTRPLVPTVDGSPAGENAPGTYPDRSVTAVNFKMVIPADGIGPNGTPIIYNDADKNEVIVTIEGQGPIPWSAPGYNQGDVDFLIGAADADAAQRNLGPYSNPDRDRNQSGDTATRAALPQSHAWAPTTQDGVVLPTIRRNSQVWNDGAPVFHAFAWTSTYDGSSRAGFNMLDGEFGSAAIYLCFGKLGETAVLPASSSPNALREANIDNAAAWFPFAQGWKAGHVRGTPPASWQVQGGHSPALTAGLTTKFSAAEIVFWDEAIEGLATLKLPGVNSLNDGLLFAVSTHEGNDNRGKRVTAPPLADGSGWTIAVRQDDEVRDPATYAAADQAGFAFVYVPLDSVNLVGGRIKGADGSKAISAGEFTLTRLAAGRYELTLPGKTGTNGMLVLQNSGNLADQSSVSDTSVLTYEYTDGKFVIESRYAAGDGTSPDTFPLRDADFSFAWVDFTTPLAPPGSVVPATSLSIVVQGSNVVVSWPAADTGWTLQSSGGLTSPVWQSVPGVANNSVTLPVAGAASYFRLSR